MGPQVESVHHGVVGAYENHAAALGNGCIEMLFAGNRETRGQVPSRVQPGDHQFQHADAHLLKHLAGQRLLLSFRQLREAARNVHQGHVPACPAQPVQQVSQAAAHAAQQRQRQSHHQPGQPHQQPRGGVLEPSRVFGDTSRGVFFTAANRRGWRRLFRRRLRRCLGAGHGMFPPAARGTGDRCCG